MVFKDRFTWVRVVCSTGQPCMVMNPLLSQRRTSKFYLGAAVARKRLRNQRRRAQKRRNLKKIVDSSVPVFNLEDIEEGVEGTQILLRSYPS